MRRRDVDETAAVLVEVRADALQSTGTGWMGMPALREIRDAPRQQGFSMHSFRVCP